MEIQGASNRTATICVALANLASAPIALCMQRGQMSEHLLPFAAVFMLTSGTIHLAAITVWGWANGSPRPALRPAICPELAKGLPPIGMFLYLAVAARHLGYSAVSVLPPLGPIAYSIGATILVPEMGMTPARLRAVAPYMAGAVIGSLGLVAAQGVSPGDILGGNGLSSLLGWSIGIAGIATISLEAYQIKYGARHSQRNQSPPKNPRLALGMGAINYTGWANLAVGAAALLTARLLTGADLTQEQFLWTLAAGTCQGVSQPSYRLLYATANDTRIFLLGYLASPLSLLCFALTGGLDVARPAMLPAALVVITTITLISQAHYLLPRGAGYAAALTMLVAGAAWVAWN